MAKRPGRHVRLAGAWGTSPSSGALMGIRVVTLSNLLKVALPPLFISSIPRKAIGFSYPRGREGQLLGFALAALTVVTSLLFATRLGLPAGLLMVWFVGGTAGLTIYNSTREGLAFVKDSCWTCRLRPIIEEHEIMHLNGESSEEAVWREAKKKYSFESLQLGSDPTICSFCPIAKRLKEN